MKGEVIYLYAFDVADEINTSRVQGILSEKPFPLPIRLDRTSPKDVLIRRPLAIEPQPLGVRVHGCPACLSVRVYDVGVVAIAVRVPVESDRLGGLVGFHHTVTDSGESLDAIALRYCARVCDSLRHYMFRAVPPSEPEAYTVFCLTEIPNVEDVSCWLSEERREVAGLLSETEPNKLSEAQVAEVLKVQCSFEKTDLVVIDWDAALIVDLTGYVDDVLYVLEVANLQLEEFQVMDGRLDQHFERIYDDLERRPLWSTSTKTLAALRRLRVDVAKLADEVTHISKLFGDWYLARVYLGARDRFHLDHWRQSIETRLTQLDQVYGVVSSEVYDRRMLWLEIAIVVLFVIDIVGLFFWKR
jgi:hypothetical protein